MSDKIQFIKRGNMAIGVSYTEFKKVKYIDIRNYYDANGEWKPTAKGIMIPIDNCQDVLRVFEDLVNEHAPERSEPKATVKASTSDVELYLVSRFKPKFEQGVMEMPLRRALERSSSARSKARNLTLKSHKSEPYKVFKYTGPKPTVVLQHGVEIYVFEEDAGSCHISQIDS